MDDQGGATTSCDGAVDNNNGHTSKAKVRIHRIFVYAFERAEMDDSLKKQCQQLTTDIFDAVTEETETGKASMSLLFGRLCHDVTILAIIWFGFYEYGIAATMRDFLEIWIDNRSLLFNTRGFDLRSIW